MANVARLGFLRGGSRHAGRCQGHVLEIHRQIKKSPSRRRRFLDWGGCSTWNLDSSMTGLARGTSLAEALCRVGPMIRRAGLPSSTLIGRSGIFDSMTWPSRIEVIETCQRA
jgi:hypothetical protein